MKLVSTRLLTAAASSLLLALAACGQLDNGDQSTRDGSSEGKPLTKPKAQPPSLRGVSTAAADFSVSTASTSVSLTAGGSAATSIVTVSASNGFTADVALAVSGLPKGVVVQFAPPSVAGGSGNSTLTLTAVSFAPTGSGTVTISAASGNVSHSTTISVSVQAAAQPDFSVVVTPGSATIRAGGAATTAQVSVTASSGFTGVVALSTAGAPSGVTASLDQSSISGSGTAQLTISSIA